MPFTKEEIVILLLEDQIVKDFISTLTTMNKLTAEQYLCRLNIFIAKSEILRIMQQSTIEKL